MLNVIKFTRIVYMTQKFPKSENIRIPKRSVGIADLNTKAMRLMASQRAQVNTEIIRRIACGGRLGNILRSEGFDQETFGVQMLR